MQWTHSAIRSLGDFTTPGLAAFFGIQLAFEVNLTTQGLPLPTLLLDSRIDEDEDQGEDLPFVDANAAPATTAAGARTAMDSFSPVEPLSGWTRPSAPPSTYGISFTGSCTKYREESEPAVQNSGFVDRAPSGLHCGCVQPADPLRSPVTRAHATTAFPHSCLAGGQDTSVRAKAAVRFSYTVQFWFLSGQLLLPGLSRSALVLATRRNGSSRPSFSTAPSMSGVEHPPRRPAATTPTSAGRNTKQRTAARNGTTSVSGTAPGPDRIPDSLRSILPPHVLPLLALALGDTAPLSQFTIFDKLAGPFVVPKLDTWTTEQCRAFALLATRLPGAGARVLLHERVGWPSPQIVVSTAGLAGTHRAVVLGVLGLPNRLTVCEARVMAAVGTLAVDAVFQMSLPYGSLAIESRVNDAAVPCSAPIPLDADHVDLGLDLPSEAASGSDTAGDTVSLFSIARGYTPAEAQPLLGKRYRGHDEDAIAAPDAEPRSVEAGHVGLRPPTAANPRKRNRPGAAPADCQVSPAQMGMPSVAPAQCSHDARPPFSVFDVTGGHTIRFREPDWDPAACQADAVRHSRTPDPDGRALLTPHLGFPTPQVVVFHRRLALSHRAVLLSLQGRRGAEVVEVPFGQTIAQAYSLSGLAYGPEFLVSCSVNGVRWDCNGPLPPTADTVHIWLAFPVPDRDGRIVLRSASGQPWPTSPHLPRQQVPLPLPTAENHVDSPSSYPSDGSLDADDEAAALMQLSTHASSPSAPDTGVVSPEESPEVDVGNSSVTVPADSSSADRPVESAPLVAPLCATSPSPSSRPVPFTVFDEIFDFRTFTGESHWVERDFIAEALSSARIDAQLWARVLRYELASQPSPQVMLTHDRGDDFRRGVVFDLTPFGGLPVTFALPDGSSLAEAVQVLAVVHSDAAAARAYDAFTQGLCACHSNGVIVDAAAPLPADADVVQFYVLQDALPSAPHDTSGVPTGGHVVQMSPQASFVAEGPGITGSPAPDRAVNPDGRSRVASGSAIEASETSLFVVFDHVHQVQRRVRQAHWHEG